MDWKQSSKRRTNVALLSMAALLWAHTSARSAEPANAAVDDRLIAIDVLLIPDEAMWKKALAANAQLRESYPQCYTLGTEQIPHISLVHRYVREKSLPQVEQNIADWARRAQPLDMELTATEFTSAKWNGLAITTIGIERTPPLDDFQLGVVKSIGINAVLRGGTAAAFHINRELPDIEPAIVTYVADFVPKYSGENYHPHVTVGVAQEDFVNKLKAKPFEKFTFKPAKLAIYQLGSYGTAQKKLWEWEPKPARKRRPQTSQAS